MVWPKNMPFPILFCPFSACCLLKKYYFCTEIHHTYNP